ncbi:MAG: hypothetical protein QGD94_12260, partial [Planctomycetia bacterium]|nr:hypothetical protein [Planctomycetia bacterium]
MTAASSGTATTSPRGIYLFVNSNDAETVTCNADKLGMEEGTIVFDEFSETVLDVKRDGGSVEFRTPAGPSLIQMASAETIAENIIARVAEMFEAQRLQRKMDAQFGLGYQRKPWNVRDDIPGVNDEVELGEPLRPWQPFCQGYVIDLKTKKSGAGSLRTDGKAYTVYAGQWAYHNRQGAAQFVMVNQEKPTPLTLTGFSKAE